MIDYAVNNIQVVQEFILNDAIMNHSRNNASLQMSEVDLSFCDALAIQCSGETSSGPVNRGIPMALRTV